jgi:hypothetical protein
METEEEEEMEEKMKERVELEEIFEKELEEFKEKLKNAETCEEIEDLELTLYGNRMCYCYHNEANGWAVLRAFRDKENLKFKMKTYWTGRSDYGEYESFTEVSEDEIDDVSAFREFVEMNLDYYVECFEKWLYCEHLEEEEFEDDIEEWY